ncbi:hypothetical protein D1AOALGA4SA_4131 [Olavius algarvensis Delta 1 endosymbiont]|nr:hypothetical protein D1AOALGA4SA_4131 [Olavius algarvensis Delta 1 endosymbiont]
MAPGMLEFAAKNRHGQPDIVCLYWMSHFNEKCYYKSVKFGGET